MAKKKVAKKRTSKKVSRTQKNKAGVKKIKALIKKQKKVVKRKVKKGRILKADNKQTPKTRKSLKSDRARKALPPGKRISASGNTYTEHRQNRTDKVGTRL